MVVAAREGQGPAIGQRHRAEDRTGRSTGADLEATRVDGSSAGIGIVARQDQRAEVGPRQLACTGQFRTDHGRKGATRQGAVADADRRGRSGQGDRVALDRIAIGRELHARDADRAGHVVDRDQAAGALENGEAGLRLHRAIEEAIGVGPFRTGRRPDARTAVDRAVVVLGAVAAVPEQQGGRGVDHIDLTRDRGLDRHTLRAARRRAEGQAVVGQDAAVGHQAIDAETIGTGAGDVQHAVQRQVAADGEQGRAARAAEGRIDDRAGRKVERADGQVTPLSPRQDAAVGDGQGTVDRAGAAERRAAVDQGICRERPVDGERAPVDGGAVCEAAGAGQGQLTEIVGEGFETGDRRQGERRDGGAAEGRDEAIGTRAAIHGAADGPALEDEAVVARAQQRRGHRAGPAQGHGVHARAGRGIIGAGQRAGDGKIPRAAAGGQDLSIGGRSALQVDVDGARA